MRFLIDAETLQIDRHVTRQRQITRIEALDLINRRSRILGKVEDVYFALRENDSHTNCCVTERVDRVLLPRWNIPFHTCPRQ